MIPKRFLEEQFDSIEATRAELSQRELDLENIEQQMEDLIKLLSDILNEAEDLVDAQAIFHFQQALTAVFRDKYPDL